MRYGVVTGGVVPGGMGVRDMVRARGTPRGTGPGANPHCNCTVSPLWPTVAPFGLFWLHLASFGSILALFGLLWLHFGLIWPPLASF